MKAKELAELLLENPDFQVTVNYADTSQCSLEKLYPEYHSLNITGISDIKYIDKVIVLDYD